MDSEHPVSVSSMPDQNRTNPANSDTVQPTNDEHFLHHLERLEQSKRDAMTDNERLKKMQMLLIEKLQSAQDERNAAGRLAMGIISEEGALGGRNYGLALRRRGLEERLSTALSEESKLRGGLTRALDDGRSQSTREELQATKNRLLEAAKYFETEEIVGNPADGPDPTSLDVDRASRALESAKQVLEEMNRRLETARSNETKLREKHRIEQVKNEASRA